MIVAIMQPYFFPYIGYFQLMHAVDTFVFFDDVQYIERGWVNRNRIALHGEGCWLTFPVVKASRTFHINKRYYIENDEVINRLERQINAAYHAFARHAAAIANIAGLLRFDDTNVARYNANLLMELGRQLQTDCTFAFSSQIAKPDGLKGEAKVIALCRALGATQYVNPIGGHELYDPENFRKAGLKLSFLKTRVPPLSLSAGPQHLSIIDSLMRHGLDHCITQMSQYALLDQNAARAATSGATT